MGTGPFDVAAADQQQQLRALIMRIHADTSLSQQEKAVQVQNLMTSSYMEAKRATHMHAQEDVQVAIYHREGVLGCRHYARNNKVLAPCCNKWVGCRLCHDDDEDHKIDRYAIRQMVCMHCWAVQPVAKTCSNAECGKDMAVYFCNICNLFDNDPTKKIYHCGKCGLCRIGEGLDKDYFHCEKCNVCMAVNLRGRHKCIERNLESNCPICSEFMFTSTSTIIFMKCGHCIHHTCYKHHIKNSYQCPVCLKSLGNMEEYFRKIDEFLTEQPMPDEYRESRAKISCNDCEMRSEAPFHFSYHKCQECGSYNTKVLSVKHSEALQRAMGISLHASSTGNEDMSLDQERGGQNRGDQNAYGGL
eukprot:comp22966_c0_seq1/m.36474 comp22966_c0_seq1/g.36474  ORF comp22966_c0_seq1/g.36474 comp22966_c0_seq1/m.36474 type:complete len:359 (-) comp22966_c0_seq1:402-1478(-)